MMSDSNMLFHHPFCSWYMLPRVGCQMCERFYKEFPLDGLNSLDELKEKYFPDVVKRTENDQ